MIKPTKLGIYFAKVKEYKFIITLFKNIVIEGISQINQNKKDTALNTMPFVLSILLYIALFCEISYRNSIFS